MSASTFVKTGSQFFLLLLLTYILVSLYSIHAHPYSDALLFLKKLGFMWQKQRTKRIRRKIEKEKKFPNPNNKKEKKASAFDYCK